MKKYFAAAAVAVMVFAFAAFAATLNVTSGPLAAGESNVESCADNAKVSYETGFEGNPGGDALAPVVTKVNVTFSEGDCNGSFADVTVLRAKTNDAQNIGALRLAQGVQQVSDNAVSFSATGLAIADVERVAVVVSDTDNTSFARGAFAS